MSSLQQIVHRVATEGEFRQQLQSPGLDLDSLALLAEEERTALVALRELLHLRSDELLRLAEESSISTQQLWI